MRPAAPEFFGDLLSRGNDPFYRSLLTIYEARYVPPPASAGRFAFARSNGMRRGVRNDVRGPEPVPAAPRKPDTSVLGMLDQDQKVDLSIDLSPGQRDVKPDVVRLAPAVAEERDIRDLPYKPARKDDEISRLTRFVPRSSSAEARPRSRVRSNQPTSLPATPAAMPTPSISFAGMDSTTGGCNCLPPDTDGDVGPSNYIQSVNSSFQIFDKNGNSLTGPTTYNSFFSALGPTTLCGDGLHNDGDGVVFYDHVADRWVVSDFALVAFPGPGPFYECIGVSKTNDPVSGGWWLYSIQVDPNNPNYIGDYPKFGVWSDGYYMTVNLFSGLSTATESFNGVRVYALDRNAMISGSAGNLIAFNVLPADLGFQYSLLPATYRLGNAPPAGQPEWLMDIDSPEDGTQTLNTVYVRRFHADFVTPANSTLGVGASHAPDGTITVAPFVDAFTSTGDYTIVPNGTTSSASALDSLGDKLMYPLVYQNRAGVESIWATHTVNNNLNSTGPTAIRWYQFNMSGNTIAATPAQQQTFDNGSDGLWRWMPSINVDRLGDMGVGYTVSSTSLLPQIRYAGRLATDAANTLGQGEATLIAGTGTQTDPRGRWGDYSATFVDPTTGCTFYHTNEYYTATTNAGWNTRVGAFAVPNCLVPTAALVSVAGRVFTAEGVGLRNAVVTLRAADGSVHTAVTGAFGYYNFDNIANGNYVASVSSRHYAFQPRALVVNDTLNEIDFSASR